MVAPGRRWSPAWMDLGRVDEVVEAGSTEIWEVTNDHGRLHNFHPHLIHFAVLDIDGSPPPSHWRAGRTPSTCRHAAPCA